MRNAWLPGDQLPELKSDYFRIEIKMEGKPNGCIW